MIAFKEIDRSNFFDVIKLSVADEQSEFVAKNLFSLAQAKAFPECVLYEKLGFDEDGRVIDGEVVYKLEY
ncbi:hypothetical protein J23TS9_16430 [Paenibacillus sp. J23TS9]|uniref:hypothetical protein n=1 Tax=Paenibacillus sp. J23TS9 TaxID=2807193 RepID=UPI001B07844B|nr:hypothetical protein [Paenibacillus sp. J23TS9]GIP26513.1 hypothetical protein J23TS9_16430 [Paenibacillus sp. J23TS9]